jgi:hypothetical protein
MRWTNTRSRRLSARVGTGASPVQAERKLGPAVWRYPKPRRAEFFRCKLRRGCAYLPIGTERKNLLLRSFGIIELGGNSRQIFAFKGLIRKIFRNKDLGCQRALKMGLGQLRGPSWETGALLAAPIRSPLSRMAGSMSVTDGPGVCDEKVLPAESELQVRIVIYSGVYSGIGDRRTPPPKRRFSLLAKGDRARLYLGVETMRSIPVVVPGIMGSTLATGSGPQSHFLWSDDFRENYATLVNSSGSLRWSGNRACAKLLNKVVFTAPILKFPLNKFDLWSRSLAWIRAHPRLDGALLIEFGYDWRAPLEETALQFSIHLRDAVGCDIRVQRPRDISDFVFFMHSMGGVLVQLALGNGLLHPSPSVPR